MGWFGVVRAGYSRLLVSGNRAIRYSAYELLIAFHSNYVPSYLAPFLIYGEIMVKNRRFRPTPPVFCAPVLGVIPWNFADTSHIKKLVHGHCLFDLPTLAERRLSLCSTLFRQITSVARAAYIHSSYR